MDQTSGDDSALVVVDRLQDHQVVTVDEVVQPLLIIDPRASLPAARPIRELLFPQRLTNHREWTMRWPGSSPQFTAPGYV
jgi:hypothetical protein